MSRVVLVLLLQIYVKKARYLKQGQNISVIGECAGSLIMLTGRYIIGNVNLQLSP